MNSLREQLTIVIENRPIKDQPKTIITVSFNGRGPRP